MSVIISRRKICVSFLYPALIVVSVRSVGWLQVHLVQLSLKSVEESAIVLRPCS